MDKDNPYYRIFGTESERRLAAYWQILTVLRRLQKIRLITCAKARKTKTYYASKQFKAME